MIGYPVKKCGHSVHLQAINTVSQTSPVRLAAFYSLVCDSNSGLYLRILRLRFGLDETIHRPYGLIMVIGIPITNS